MGHFFRWHEYKVLLYRLVLAYIFYTINRFLFFVYNYSILEIHTLGDYLRLSGIGLMFDTTSIFYLSSLFVVFSMLPLGINTKSSYQKVLAYLYFIPHLAGMLSNFVDFIYYPFNFNRTTISEWSVIENEPNKMAMMFRLALDYWHVVVIFILISLLWIGLYNRVKVVPKKFTSGKGWYVLTSTVSFLVMATVMIFGIRGGYGKSSRPINMVDANRHVTKMQHADFLLNTPFTIIRTLNKDTYKKVPYEMPQSVVDSLAQPIKHYPGEKKDTPNFVVIVLESFGREYIGAFNRNTKISDYVSYTPFLDALANESLIFDNAFANGRKSIHGMSSVLSGVPSFKDAFTSSPYANQKMQSAISILDSLGYDTSFFHGAPNGSMGFLGFSNILGFDHYYGKDEFNDDSQFDGFWGIWDDPFLQYTKSVLDQKQTPFFSTIFTVSSHEPYVVPKSFEGKFPKGTNRMHQCVGYTDYALKRFFESAQQTSWYDNTIFIITADHTNLVGYDEFLKPINRYAVPILIHSPKHQYKGVISDLAQQIDIYPTIVQLTGYDKPFRSWGRSLLDTTNTTTPFVMNWNTRNYQYSKGKYICIFDGKQAIGFYAIDDLGLENNLIANRTPEMDALELDCKAFLKDYFDRIIDGKL